MFEIDISLIFSFFISLINILVLLLWAVGSFGDDLDDGTVAAGRLRRAAEILASTNANHQQAGSSSVVPGNVTVSSNNKPELVTVKFTASSEVATTASIPQATEVSNQTTPVEDLHETVTKATTTVMMTTSTLMTTAATTTTSITPSMSTSSSPSIALVSDEEYPADYHGAATSTGDDSPEETTLDKSADPPVTTTSSPPKPSSTARLEEIAPTATTITTTMTTTTSTAATTEANHRNSSSRPGGGSTQQLLAAVGRALSQDENVPWPEAKSTKVIGTIIEDIHGPFSEGSPSSSTVEALNNGSITAIVLCTFVILLTTAGNEKNTFRLVRRLISS